MHYFSTRGQDGPLGYEDALLSGLARDGGLYLPDDLLGHTVAVDHRPFDHRQPVAHQESALHVLHAILVFGNHIFERVAGIGDELQGVHGRAFTAYAIERAVGGRVGHIGTVSLRYICLLCLVVASRNEECRHEACQGND